MLLKFILILSWQFFLFISSSIPHNIIWNILWKILVYISCSNLKPYFQLFISTCLYICTCMSLLSLETLLILFPEFLLVQFLYHPSSIPMPFLTESSVSLGELGMKSFQLFCIDWFLWIILEGIYHDIIGLLL